MKYIIFYQILISSQLLNALSQWDVVYKHLTLGKYADVSRIGPFFIIRYLKQTHILETHVSNIFGANSRHGDILEMDKIGNRDLIHPPVSLLPVSFHPASSW